MIKPEELVPLIKLQWIKGDKEGDVEIVKDTEVMGEFVWINFYGGGRINGGVIDEMMVAIGVAEASEVEPHSTQKEVKSNAELDQLSNNQAPKELREPTKQVDESLSEAPLHAFGFEILQKATKDSTMELNIKIDFDFISEDKIKMLLELYGDDLYQALKEYIKLQLSDDVIDVCIEQYISNKFPEYALLEDVTINEVNLEDDILEDIILIDINKEDE